MLGILTAVSRNATHFVFEGRDIRLNTAVGIFITMNPGYAGRVELPDNLKSLFRPVSMMVPDSALIAEIMLFAEGFSNTRILAKKVDTLYKLAIQQLSKQDHYDFGLRALTTALRSAGSRKRADMSIPDENVLLMAMKDNNVPKLTAEDVPLFNGILLDLFPGVEGSNMDYSNFRAAITEEMKSENLQQLEITYSKVIQLYETKCSRHGVMIVGETGSGKSTAWKLLQSSLNRLAKSSPELYVPVKTFMINPKALSLTELYGEFNLATNEWTDGVLSTVMRNACSDEKKDQKWLILDGPVDTLWIESMNTVLDDNKVLTLINGERIALPEQVSLLFEVENLSTASPATVSRCGMIYTDYSDLGWRPYFDSWLNQKTETTPIDLIRRLAEKYLPQLLEFRRSCAQFVPVPESALIKSFCSLFDSVATLENGVDVADLDNFPRMIELWFLFSTIWALGGPLTSEARIKFDSFFREIEGQFPSKDTVFEYSVDKTNKNWVSWEEKLPTSWRYNSALPFYRIFIPTIDTLRYEFIFRAFLKNKHPVLLVGDVGTGKTSLAQNSIQQPDNPFNVLLINMSAQTSSSSIQSIIEGRLEKRTKNVFVPTGGKPLLVFVDDLNMPMKDTFGSQPPLEFLKHYMDYKFAYDRQKQQVKYFNDVMLAAAMGPPGGGRNMLSPRIQARFNIMNMPFPAEKSIQRIFEMILNQKLQDFEEDIKALSESIVPATIDIFNTVSIQMLPTPTKMHYIFNLRDISKVFQGFMRANKDFYDTSDMMLKLWVHELCRVFLDRMTCKQDKDTFISIVNEKLINVFKTSLEQLNIAKRLPVFGDFLKISSQDNPPYEEIPNSDALKRFMEEKLEEYNAEPGVVALQLVLFRDAIEHICRIARVLRQPCGNVFLIGVGGSGRQSLTQLASYLVQMKVFQIKITKNYRHVDFREDLKKLYKATGIDNVQYTFLITDQQIVTEVILEDISNILSSGEVKMINLDTESIFTRRDARNTYRYARYNKRIRVSGSFVCDVY
jgi:dynein heavy chain